MAAARVAVAGASVRGASHVRSNAPNQDAVRWRLGSGSTEAMVVAVADGHGSPKSFRSHLGAELAVVLATEMLWTRLADAPPARNPQEEARTLRGLLPQVTERWAAEVRRELQGRPFEAAELRRLQERGGSTALAELERNPLLAYGATLLTVLVSRAAVHYVQLGDGDILTVWRNGEVRRPLPMDPQLIANETTSLCQPSAWQQFRVGADSLNDAPRLILLSSDGYANSFASEDEFLQVGSDLLEMIERDGLQAVEGRLEGWLNETSEHGAGDDVTLAIISVPFSTTEPPPVVPPPAPAATLPMATVVPPPPVPLEPRREPWARPEEEPTTGGRRLIVRVDGRTYDVTGLRRVKIGRDPSADIRSGNRFVSKQHALLRSGRAGWTLEDLGSKGGLWHGGRRLERLAVVEPAEVWLGRPGEGDLVELVPGGLPARPEADRRQRALLAGAGALLALLLSMGLLWGINRSEEPAAPTPPATSTPPVTSIPPTSTVPTAHPRRTI
jgi:Protein phosphatase 2C/FHA domain